MMIYSSEYMKYGNYAYICEEIIIQNKMNDGEQLKVYTYSIQNGVCCYFLFHHIFTCCIRDDLKQFVLYILQGALIWSSKRLVKEVSPEFVCISWIQICQTL